LPANEPRSAPDDEWSLSQDTDGCALPNLAAILLSVPKKDNTLAHMEACPVEISTAAIWRNGGEAAGTAVG